MVTDVDRWARLVGRPSPWAGRLQVMVGFIWPGTSVLDVGAGSMELQRYLPDGCSYRPLDVVASSPFTLVCDLNRDVHPLADEPFEWDVAVLSGVLEYMFCLPRALGIVSAKARRLVLSYDHTPDHDARRAAGWLNYYDRDALLMTADAFHLRGDQVASWEGQAIYEFTR